MRFRLLLCVAFVLAAISAGPTATSGAAGCGATGAPTTTVYLPNITKTLGGPSGWVTPFIVQNVGTAPTTLEVSFYGFSDGGLVTCRSVPGLQPATSFADIPNSDADLPGGSAFSVVVRSFGSEVVAVVNEHQGEGVRAEALSYVGLTSGATRVGLPWVARAHDGWLTTFIIQNLGSANATVTAAFASDDGTKTATLTRTILPGRSAAVNPANEPDLVDGTSYAVVLTSDQPIGVVANAHNDAATASQPMAFSYNGAPLATSDAHVPWVGRNADGGRTTTVVLQNLGTSDASPQLTFRRIGGSEQAAVQMGSLRPGRAARYALPAPAPSCPVGGSSSCPREGEHSLTVSGGSFGVLAYTVGLGSVMGGTGSAGASTRVYLPNVTRTLGGTTGWTTPIAVQSAGATTATLRWYRFADGALAITQYVGALTSGSSVKVDPRDVAELVDGSQYAVVVDGNGPLRATVLELSAAGGDGAMAYEGFVASGVVTSAPVLASVTLAPAAVTTLTGSVQQFIATFKDQAGNAFTGVPSTWSASPSSLGTVTSQGLFTASATPGTGTVTVTFGALTAIANVAVAAHTVSLGGLTFRVTASASADLYVESAISTADGQTIATTVEPDVAHVAGAFGRSFAKRPSIYVFANGASMTSGWVPSLQGTTTPRTNVNGVYLASSNKIALHWENMRQHEPQHTLRHELVHQMEMQITNASDSVPLWFREGIARLEDLTTPRGEWRMLESRYSAVSMAATNTLFALSLSDDAFDDLAPLERHYAYYESAETVRLLRADHTHAGILRLLDAVGQGQTFTVAYSATTGRPIEVFTAQRQERLRALAPSSPGVVTAAGSFTGNPQDLTFMLHGFVPSSAVHILVEGPNGLRNVESSRTKTVSAYGEYTSFLGDLWPAGNYKFTVTSGTTVVTATVVKIGAATASTLLPDVRPQLPLLDLGEIPLSARW